jgi:hypothetical protein
MIKKEIKKEKGEKLSHFFSRNMMAQSCNQSVQLSFIIMSVKSIELFNVENLFVIIREKKNYLLK